ncbi:uncharacterized protein LOC135827357 [Sycon ciliatum]|uniref:uncharacterized protein LOC135827357 n=1 Tax=Sycon ciliatum TaxID=27933 RepID=UPI0020AE054A|eukprot:scpid50530/ scgid10938/ Vacuolar protein 8
MPRLGRLLCCGWRKKSQKDDGIYHPLLPDDERQAINDLLQFFRTSVDIGQPTEEQMRSLLYVSYSERVDLQRTAALCFAEISDRMRAEAKMEMVEALVSLLQVHDVEVQQASSLALSNLALKGPACNKRTIMQAGALRPLISLLNSSNEDVQCNACGCITTLATTEVNKRNVVEHGALRPLLQLARSQDPRVQRNAAGAILNITHIDTNRDEMVRSNALPVLLDLLKSPDRDVQYYTAAALSNIAVNEHHRAAIVAINNGSVLPDLLQLLTNSSNKVKSQACLALRNLASDDSNQEQIVQLGGLNHLLPLLHSQDQETCTAAVAAVRNISIHDGNAIHIVKGNFLPELATLLTRERWPEAQCHAAGTLRNLAAEKQTAALLQSGVVDTAMDLLDNSRCPDAVLAEATAALAILCASEDALTDIMARRGKPLCRALLVRAKDSQDAEVRYNCIGAIGHIAMDVSTHQVLLSCQPSLLQLLNGLMLQSEPAFVHLSLWVLQQLCKGGADTMQAVRISVVYQQLQKVAHGSEHRKEIVDLATSIINSLSVESQKSPSPTSPA